MWQDHMDGWGWFWGAAMMIAVSALVVWAALSSARRGQRPDGPDESVRTDPEDVLADRLARGDIDVAEYEERIAALRGTRPTTRT